MAEYVLDHHLDGEAARLALMSRLLDPMHRRHIESLGVGPGSRTLEVGCGNGELSRRLAPLCDAYAGLDAGEAALASARRAVPDGRFVQGFLPCDLPNGPAGRPHDLVVLSEVLYFLDEPGLAALASQLVRRWPDAEVLAVNWLGPSGNPLEGEAALDAFARALPAAFAATPVARTDRFRIDRFAPS